MHSCEIECLSINSHGKSDKNETKESEKKHKKMAQRNGFEV